MSKEDLVREVVGAADEWGGVDVIFNNAGIMLDAVCSHFTRVNGNGIRLTFRLGRRCGLYHRSRVG